MPVPQGTDGEGWMPFQAPNQHR